MKTFLTTALIIMADVVLATIGTAVLFSVLTAITR